MNVKNKFHCNQLKLKERSADQQNHYSWRIPVHDTDRLRHVRQCLYMRTTSFSSGEADMTSCTGSGLRNYSFPPLLSCILSGNYTHLGKIRSLCLSLSLSRCLARSRFLPYKHTHTYTHTHTHTHFLSLFYPQGKLSYCICGDFAFHPIMHATLTHMRVKKHSEDVAPCINIHYSF